MAFFTPPETGAPRFGGAVAASRPLYGPQAQKWTYKFAGKEAHGATWYALSHWYFYWLKARCAWASKWHHDMFEAPPPLAWIHVLSHLGPKVYLDASTMAALHDCAGAGWAPKLYAAPFARGA